MNRNIKFITKEEWSERYWEELSKIREETWKCPKFDDRVNFILCGIRQRNLPTDIGALSCEQCRNRSKDIKDP